MVNVTSTLVELNVVPSGGEQGGGLIDPFMDLGRDVELEAAWGSAGFICEAFFGMEPCVDFLRWIFAKRALSEGKLLRIVPVEGSTPAEILS